MSTMSNNPEAFLKISDSIASVILDALESDGSEDGERESKLSSEDAAAMIMDAIIINISESTDDDGRFIAIVDPETADEDIDE